MRQTTIFAVLIATVMSVSLFYLKHEVTNLEDELKLLNRSIVADREAVHVLNAEWSHLNNLNRLEDLAKRHLKMQPTNPRQIKEARGLSYIQVVDDPDLEATVPP